MLNTLHRLRRYGLVGALVIAPSVMLYAQTRNPASRGPVVGVIVDATSIIEKGLLAMTGGVSDVLFKYVGAVRQSDDLVRLRRDAVAQQALKARIAELEYENDILKGLLKTGQGLPQTRPIGARIIGRTGEPLSHLARLEQGKWGGVARGDGVITQDGVVGRILDAGRTASDVLFLTDPSSVLDVVVQRTRARGLLRGEGRDEQYGLRIDDFDRLADVIEGDVIVTSGLDPSFPPGLLVGEIAEVTGALDGLYTRALVRPIVDFGKLEHVLVLVHNRGTAPVRLGGAEPMVAEERAIPRANDGPEQTTASADESVRGEGNKTQANIVPGRLQAPAAAAVKPQRAKPVPSEAIAPATDSTVPALRLKQNAVATDVVSASQKTSTATAPHRSSSSPSNIEQKEVETGSHAEPKKDGSIHAGSPSASNVASTRPGSKPKPQTKAIRNNQSERPTAPKQGLDASKSEVEVEE